MKVESGCPHPEEPQQATCCVHVSADHDLALARRFTGNGTETIWLCAECGPTPVYKLELRSVCTPCGRDIGPHVGSDVRALGEPEVLVRETKMQFEHETRSVGLDTAVLIGLAPVPRRAGKWIGVTEAGAVVLVDLENRTSAELLQLGDPAAGLFGDHVYPAEVREKVEFFEQYGAASQSSSSGHPQWQLGSALAAELPILVLPSPDGDLIAICNRWGRYGVIVEAATGRVVMALDRGDYHPGQTEFPVAWVENASCLHVVHGTAWNRLDVTDPRTGVLMTDRHPTSYERGETRPAHYLDYFHGRLTVSPGQDRIVEDGWVWHPVGVVTAWSLDAWFESNVWESEDGGSLRRLCDRSYFWDSPICWVDETVVAVWGLGDDDDWMVPGVRVFDAKSGDEKRAFAGPLGHLVFDRRLFAYSTAFGTSVWNVETGERLLDDPDLRPLGYHPLDRQFLSRVGGDFRVSRLQQDA
ncbi:MAG TPA: hypothetical protein VF337_01960 [Candidatus Limnocylindrales bacterium]